MDLTTQIAKSHKLLDAAMRLYKPSTVIALTSGGHDSQVSTQIAHDWSRRYGHSVTFKAIALDTGVAADGWREWVTGMARERRWRFEVWDNSDVGWGWYQADALENGFCYTRYGHTTFYYRMLKERTVSKIVQAHKKNYHDRVLFVAGIYRAESTARANAEEMRRTGAAAWVNPILYWQKDELAHYRVVHNLPNNPFYDTVGGSGDCQCNWGQFITLETLRKHSPRLAGKIDSINADVIAQHGYGWGERPSKGLLSERQGQLTLPGIAPLYDGVNLCAACERPKPGTNEALDSWLIDRIDWNAE